MRIRTRITQEARARGFTAAEVAKRLGWYRSNVSAADAGARTMSLQALAKVADLLGCSPADLIEVGAAVSTPLFRRRELAAWLAQRDGGTPDETDKRWVHTAQLAWQRHYRAARRSP